MAFKKLDKIDAEEFRHISLETLLSKMLADGTFFRLEYETDRHANHTSQCLTYYRAIYGIEGEPRTSVYVDWDLPDLIIRICKDKKILMVAAEYQARRFKRTSVIEELGVLLQFGMFEVFYRMEDGSYSCIFRSLPGDPHAFAYAVSSETLPRLFTEIRYVLSMEGL